MHTHIGIGLKNSLVEHEERHREYHIVVLNEQWRLLTKPMAEWLVTSTINSGE
jgi:chromosome segregation and condensation protein ScpB